MQNHLCKHTFLTRMFAVVLVLCSLVLTAGCSEDPGITQPSTNGTTPVTTAPTQSTTLPQEDPQASSLVSVRQAMIGTQQLFAVAYFGTTADMEPCDPLVFMQEKAPQLCADLPFLTAIPEANTIGQRYGELYCIIPADPEATVAVNRVVETEDSWEYSNVVYRAETGAPILLFCNNAGFDPDTLVTITDSSGNTVQWHPQLDDNFRVSVPRNDDYADVALDITLYAELLALDYKIRLQQGWEKPTAADLTGTAWSSLQYRKDGSLFRCTITFREGTAFLTWNTGYDATVHEYADAPWTLTETAGFSVLEVDLGGFAGKMRYDLLIHKEQKFLYTALDVSDGEVQESMIPLMRTLSPAGPAADGLEGNWTLAYTEVEGYRDDIAAGTCTITIVPEGEDSFRISFRDNNFPESNYNNKLLTVNNGETMYDGCGNDLWVARVDHVDQHGTTFALTLLDTGELLLQSRWEMDGAPMVSYAWYTKAN